MTDGPGTPALLPLEDGIGLTVGVNLAVTVAAFIGLTVQYRGLESGTGQARPRTGQGDHGAGDQCGRIDQQL
ncbi:hypothetical protein [Saccharomonospora azurea]|uniref:hypothetical protein n=1 Tax=Saccharomonospora azurea TaxID=40988 RepID=UPI001E59C3C1|nr:hypothetical protein [Saccharomonospora azurea]